MEFVFMCLTQRLTSELSKRVRYRVEHKMKEFHIYKQTCVILFIICIPRACLNGHENFDKGPRMKNGEHSSTHLNGAEGE